MSFMKQEIYRYFPQSRIVAQLKKQEGKHYLALGNSQWLEFDQADLTERERILLNILEGEYSLRGDDPWNQFLSGQEVSRPQVINKLQFLHVRIWKESIERESRSAWLEMMADLLPMQVAQVILSDYELLFILDQEQFIDVRDLLTEMIVALEFDFGIRLTFFLGQIWSQVDDASLRRLYQEEASLFSLWQLEHNQTCTLSFASLFLWGQSKGQVLIQIKESLRSLINRQEQLSDIILTLWQEGAVATKAAQRLYIHRNTLQYRLEKWYELTGLQLRNLTDLAVCYSLVTDHLF